MRQPKENIMKVNTTDRKDNTHHFFVTSMAEWKVGYDLETLIKYFKKSKYTFAVYLVPGTTDANYEIKMYQPDVEGLVWLATYEA
jgi:hypothetical protein